MGGIQTKPNQTPKLASRYIKVNEILEKIPIDMIDETLIRHLESAYEKSIRFTTPHSDIPAEPLVPRDD